MQTAVATRIIRNHELWEPHAYQLRSVAHLMERRAAALFLDPGLGKTAIVLEAFRQLKQSGMVKRMLVIAPLRVCQLVWEQEGRKWTQFRDLTFTLLHGTRKDELLRERTDIHLINPEGIAWLSQQYFGQRLPYDIVTIDELTKFKNSQANRSKALRRKLSHVRYRWGLTGSPAPNGYMDLFGQMLVLDDGAALGRYITHFRDRFFARDFDGFGYTLQKDGGQRIEERIAPYVLRMSADDYLSMPEKTDNVIHIQLSPAARKQYDEMKKEMLLTLPEGTVTAANAAAVYTKLAQMANGAVYIGENSYAEIHTEKLDALEDLVEELAGQSLLVGYEFQHDLARLRERFPKAATLTGLSHKKIVELEAAWNNGEVSLMFAHPASAGHGLNLQGSGASHICWFSRPWDLDLYDQFIRRLLRQGTTAKHIMNHALVVRDTIDETKGKALQDKNVTQNRLLDALNAEIIRDTTTTGDNMALKKLGFQGAANTSTANAPAVQPRGWGAPAATENGQQEMGSAAPAEEPAKTPRGWGAPAGAVKDEQREAINEKLRAPEPEEEDEEPPVASRALEAFGSGVVQQLKGDGTENERVPTPRGWGAASTEAGTGTAEPASEPAQTAETGKKSPSRSRRNAPAASDAVQQTPAPATITGDSEAVSVADASRGVHISLDGLSQRAIGAALRAIADAYAS